MAPTLARLTLVGLAIGWPASTLAQEQPSTKKAAASTPETPGLLATQVTLAIQKDGKRRVFRATVLDKKDDVIRVLTAAHCVLPDDIDGPAMLLRDGTTINGRVLSVVRNPSFKSNQSREIPGADNAIARFRFKPVISPEVQALDSIKPALGLTSRPYPGPGGQTVSVRMIDQKGVEHAVKAGNYSNPRLLEWGLAYKPSPGDSGAGVFAMSGGSGGQEPRPILIGIIVANDQLGGNASLISKEMRWISDELAR